MLVVTGLQIMARPLNAGTVVVFTCSLMKLELAVRGAPQARKWAKLHRLILHAHAED